MRYLKGHHNRGKPFIAKGKRLAEMERTAIRHAAVVDDYRRGKSLVDIADRHGLAGASSVAWIVAEARARGRVVPRRLSPAVAVPSSAVQKQLRRMYRRGETWRAMRTEFGWTSDELHTQLDRVRRIEVGLYRRSAEVPVHERRALGRDARRQRVQQGLVDGQKMVLRILLAFGVPTSSSSLREVLEVVASPKDGQLIRSRLASLLRINLVARVPNDEVYRYSCKWLWWIPGDRELRPAEMTLADARRETELAALIREQEDDIAHADWSRGYDISLDTPIGDGALTVLDTLRAA